MIFPVGHGAGPRASDQYVVRVGGTAEQLSEAEFGVWVCAHQSADLDEVLAVCADADIEDAGQHLDELLRRGLVVQVDDVTAFAQQYRLLPLFIGLGNRPDDPQQFAIGLPGLEPLAVVPATTYELWQWGWVAPSLWAHCEVLGTIGERPQLDVVLDGVSALLSDFVAVLDPVS
ncbi:hypothetical protein JOF29_005755 [Kribbella aluminosa]|uniref:Uncharacterized protein n=1 Tax=Kribbella aluminosa TaxID=416017 RepID=A0ABS4USN9_9ACTN|nr:hypothetical protein [Kribbella aluminosa]MBP2354645.1 hypothetical protein [Kribbella aluminosa]